MNRKKVAFVFSGGGSLGAVHVGMLKAFFQKTGIKPDFVVGSSVGAINAAVIAGEPNLHGALALEDIWLGLKRSDIFPVSILDNIFGIMQGKNHLVSSHGLAKVIKKNLKFENLEDATIPMHAIATDFYDGTEVVLSTGNALQALLASAAIPAVFPPVRAGHHLLVDGGITNNSPISVAVSLGAKEIYVFPTGSSCALSQAPSSLIEIAGHALNLMISHRMLVDVAKYTGDVQLHIMPTLCPLSVSIFDFTKTSDLIDRAMEQTAMWIDSGGLTNAPDVEMMQPHYH